MNPTILSMWDQFSLGVTITDSKNCLLYMNPYQRRIDGYEKAEYRGKSMFELYSNVVDDYFTTQRSLDTAYPIINKTSFYRTSTNVVTSSQYSTYPYFNDDGDVDGAIIFNTDVKTLSLLFSAFSDGVLSCLPSDVYPQKPTFTFDNIIGNNLFLRQCIEQASSASLNDFAVMIWGESGTGKELFAQAIHNNSDRKEKPFIPINCAAIPEHLLEGILFGTTKGAYTDAQEKIGLLEAANGGTILLDELNSMPLMLQAKLLRAIQEKRIRRIGSIDEISIDIKFISTINVDPREAIANKNIREDLYFRLAVIMITVPSLRKRQDDIPLLCNFFLAKHHTSKRKYFDREVYQLFQNYAWPGNVRELENTIQSAIIFSKHHQLITTEMLPPYFIESCQKKLESHATQPLSDTQEPSAPLFNPMGAMDLKSILVETERYYVEQVLKKTGGNVAKASRILGITPPTLHYKIKKYGFQDFKH